MTQDSVKAIWNLGFKDTEKIFFAKWNFLPQLSCQGKGRVVKDLVSVIWREAPSQML